MIESKKHENPKGFLVIEMSPNDAVLKCGFGTNEFRLFCDTCAEYLNAHEIVYYVAVLNRLLCKKCYEEWEKVSKRYADDLDFEVRHYNNVARMLKIDETFITRERKKMRELEPRKDFIKWAVNEADKGHNYPINAVQIMSEVYNDEDFTNFEVLVDRYAESREISTDEIDRNEIEKAINEWGYYNL